MKFETTNTQQRVAAVAKQTSMLGILVLFSSLTWTNSAFADGAVDARQRAKQIFGTLPIEVANSENPITPAKIELGRKLYYEKRLSLAGDISCNSCHDLAAFGVDGEPTSPGHLGQRGGRNSPTVYNAALHISQFWDGRSPDVEDQAKGPILNPIEMAMPSEAAVIDRLSKDAIYPELFAKAFPDQAKPLTYDNLARAIGAFERRLMTPGPLDAFMAGDDSALSANQLAGLNDFMNLGCVACHNGAAIGGALYQKLGLVVPYETKDLGRYDVTRDESDKYFFKVPSLRNITKTAPYFHDGSVASLNEAVRLMGLHQLGIELDASQIHSIVSFFEALQGEIDSEYVSLR